MDCLLEHDKGFLPALAALLPTAKVRPLHLLVLTITKVLQMSVSELCIQACMC